MAGETRSSLWRKEGNSFFTTATDNLAPVLRLSRLEKAFNCYLNAHQCASDDDELASAAKNAGTTKWKIGRLSHMTGQQWTQIKFNFKEALKYFYEAYRKGVACRKPTDWSDNILASCRSSWEELLALVEAQSDADNHERMLTMLEFIDYLPLAEIKAECFMEIADYHFHRGLRDLASGEFKSCLSHMRDCHFPMHEALRLGSGSEQLLQQFTTLEADIMMQTGLAQSMQSREIGDQLFQKVVMDTEVLSTDMIWEVIDWYKDSILKVRGLDVKSEAISLSRIGLVYEKVLKIRFRARDYLKNALELAKAITPMNVTGEKWYKDTLAMLETYQKKNIMHEQEEDNNRKASVKEKIKSQVAMLNDHESDKHVDFLKFVYKTFKPWNPSYKLNLPPEPEEVDRSKQVKLLQAAIIHYHPDRVSEEDHGLELKVLHEEITKLLTNRYQTLLGC